jgi:hypothetical protein
MISQPFDANRRPGHVQFDASPTSKPSSSVLPKESLSEKGDVPSVARRSSVRFFLGDDDADDFFCGLWDRLGDRALLRSIFFWNL